VADTLEARLDEEMRLLYVAATRAQESLILVGAGSGIPAANKNTRYAWQDEILQAKSRIERLGGVYRQ
jgi:ATP-dependent exoDNAse (exonuclease V) beta subunit